MKLWDSPLISTRTAAVLCWALAVAVFFNALGNEFAYDDNLIILENPGIQSLATLPKALIEPYWPGQYGQSLGLWRPVVTALLGAEWALFDGNPVGFHLVNVLLHSGVTVLVVLLLAELLPVAGALIGGLLFAVHPVHVEAVAGVVGASELLAAFFFLWACILILRGGERLGAGRLLAILALYALAFLTKESAITLLGVVLLLDSSRSDIRVSDLKSYLARRWPLYGGMVLVAGMVLWGRYLVLRSVADPFPPLGAKILWDIPRIWTVAESWTHVVRLFFFPLDLSVDYGPAVIPISFGWGYANTLGAVLVLGFLALSIFVWRRGLLGPGTKSSRILGWGVVWMVITLSPTSNLLFLTGILLSERTLYLPSVGFIAAAAWGFLKLWEARPRLAPVVLVLCLAFGIGRSWIRTPVWESNFTLLPGLIADHPEAGRSQWLLGDSYFTIGQFSEGLRAYRMAVGILDGHYNFMVGASRNLMAHGFDRPAEVMLKQAWEQRPEFGVAPGLLSHIYDRQGRYEEAEAAARYSLERDSAKANQYHTLARALQAQGRYEEAIVARLGTIREGEGEHLEQWVWLAELHFALNDSAGALAALDSARLRANSTREARQFDSIMSSLGLKVR